MFADVIAPSPYCYYTVVVNKGAVTAASRGPTISYLALTTTRQPHWGRVTHIRVSKLTIIGSDNGLSPGRRQAIIWNNARLLLIEPLGTNVSEISFEIQRFSFKKMPMNMSSVKWRPFCLGLDALTMHSSSSAHSHFYSITYWYSETCL